MGEGVGGGTEKRSLNYETSFTYRNVFTFKPLHNTLVSLSLIIRGTPLEEPL